MLLNLEKIQSLLFKVSIYKSNNSGIFVSTFLPIHYLALKSTTTFLRLNFCIYKLEMETLGLLFLWVMNSKTYSLSLKFIYFQLKDNAYGLIKFVHQKQCVPHFLQALALIATYRSDTKYSNCISVLTK